MRIMYKSPPGRVQILRVTGEPQAMALHFDESLSSFQPCSGDQCPYCHQKPKTTASGIQHFVAVPVLAGFRQNNGSQVLGWESAVWLITQDIATSLGGPARGRRYTFNRNETTGYKAKIRRVKGGQFSKCPCPGFDAREECYKHFAASRTPKGGA